MFPHLSYDNIGEIKNQVTKNFIMEYTSRGLKINTTDMNDYNYVLQYLHHRQIQFYTFKANPDRVNAPNIGRFKQIRK